MQERFMVVECFGDSIFVEMLRYSAAKVHSGNGDVINTLKKKYNEKFGIGVIDFDKGVWPGDLKKESTTVIRKDDRQNLLLLKHNERSHYFVVLTPEFENWIDSAAREKEVERARFRGLPKDFEKFKSLCKTQKIEETEFKNYLNTIIQKKSPRITAFHSFVQEAFQHYQKHAKKKRK